MLLVLFTYALYPGSLSFVGKEAQRIEFAEVCESFQALADNWMNAIFKSELALRRFLQAACDDAERLAAKALRKRRTSAQTLRESLNQPSESIDVAAAASA